MFKKFCFLLVSAISFALLLCACGKNENIDMVKNGYMGEYTDITTQEFFDGYYLTFMGYDTSEWEGGKTDDGKELVRVIYSRQDGTMDKVTIQFTVLDSKYFTVSAFADPSVEIEEPSDLLAELNMDYMTVYTLNHSEIADDSDAENEFIRYLDTISGSSVLYGAAADYSEDRSLLCEKFGDTPLETSVPWLLSSAGFLYMMDYDLYYDYYGVDNYEIPDSNDSSIDNSDTINEDYYNFLEELDANTDEYSHWEFSRYDWDNDGIDELFAVYGGLFFNAYMFDIDEHGVVYIAADVEENYNIAGAGKGVWGKTVVDGQSYLAFYYENGEDSSTSWGSAYYSYKEVSLWSIRDNILGAKHYMHIEDYTNYSEEDGAYLRVWGDCTFDGTPIDSSVASTAVEQFEVIFYQWGGMNMEECKQSFLY